MVLSAVATAHALAGRPNEARATLAEIEALAGQRYVGRYYLAQVRVALGEQDAALTELEAALEERAHWLVAIQVDPSLAALRGQARFEGLVNRVRSAASK
jgi:hypothetical protein